MASIPGTTAGLRNLGLRSIRRPCISAGRYGVSTAGERKCGSGETRRTNCRQDRRHLRNGNLSGDGTRRNERRRNERRRGHVNQRNRSEPKRSGCHQGDEPGQASPDAGGALHHRGHHAEPRERPAYHAGYQRAVGAPGELHGGDGESGHGDRRGQCGADRGAAREARCAGHVDHAGDALEEKGGDECFNRPW